MRLNIALFAQRIPSKQEILTGQIKGILFVLNLLLWKFEQLLKPKMYGKIQDC